MFLIIQTPSYLPAAIAQRRYHQCLVIHSGEGYLCRCQAMKNIHKKTGKRLRDQFGLPTSAIVISFLGRMIRIMGMDFVLNIAPKLLEIRSDIFLVIAGAKGDLTPSVENLQGSCRVKYVTDIPFDKKPRFLRGMRCFPSPTMEKHASWGFRSKKQWHAENP